MYFESPISSRTIRKQIFVIVLLGGLLGGLVNVVHPKRIPWVQDWSGYVEAKAVEAGIDVIPLGMAFSIHKASSHLFVDARPSKEYGEGHIPKAILLPFEKLDDHFDALEQLLVSDAPVVVYCDNRECDDALLLAIELRELGKTNLLYYVDGFDLWEASECPVETD